MKHLTTVERCGLLLGCTFVVCGAHTIIWPETGVMFRFSGGGRGLSPGYAIEEVTEAKSKLYGVLAVILGAGVIAGALYTEKK